MFVFLGLYPSWAVQNGLPGHGAGTIGAMLFFGEIGGRLGALLAGRLAGLVRHPLGFCALAAFLAAAVVLAVPFGAGHLVFQAVAYGVFAFCRDLMLALILGGAMLVVGAAQRGSLNTVLNVIYQTGASLAGVAGAWLYALAPGFTANSAAAGALFAASGLMLWCITRIKAPTSG